MNKELTVDPKDATATLISVGIGSVGKNPYRDMDMFPIQPDKIASLKESIEKTGFWPSIIARPVDNMIEGDVIDQTTLQTLIAEDYDFSDVVWEKAFAHHRQVACEELGFDTILIIPQIVSDEQMLLMMANENKEGFGANINSTLETVRQVKVAIEIGIADYDTYEDYAKDAGDEPFFTTSKSFLNAQKQGVGFKTVRRFLGDTWSDRQVRVPMAVLRAVEEGLFHQEDIVNVPAMGLLEGIASIARTVYEGHTPQKKDAEAIPAPDWPMYFKEQCVALVIERCALNADKDKHVATVTVAQLEKARLALQKNGVNPASWLRSGKGKTAFSVYEASRELFLIDDQELDKNLKAIEDLSEHDGFSDWEGLKGLQGQLVKAAERMAKGEDEPPVEEGDGLDPTEEGDVDKAINEGEEEVDAGADAGAGAFDEFEAGDTPMPINQLVTTIAGRL